MKAIKLFIAALAVVMISVLGPDKAQGSTPAPSVLLSFPMATNADGINAWIETNRAQYPSVTVRFKDKNGVTQARGNTAVLTSFVNCDSFRLFFRSNVFNLITNNYAIIDQSKPFEARFDLIVDPNAPARAMIIDSTAPDLNSVTTEWLNNIPPSTTNVEINVKGLTSYSVIVYNGTPPYSNGWSCVGTNIKPSSVNQYPPELTTNDWIRPNYWYMYGLYKTRITYTTSTGETNTFTQTGALLTQPTLGIDRNNLYISMASGADTQLQSSTDYTSWSTVTNLSDFSGTTTNRVLPIPFDGPYKFFRVIPK